MSNDDIVTKAAFIETILESGTGNFPPVLEFGGVELITCRAKFEQAEQGEIVDFVRKHNALPVLFCYADATNNGTNVEERGLILPSNVEEKLNDFRVLCRESRLATAEDWGAEWFQLNTGSGDFHHMKVFYEDGFQKVYHDQRGTVDLYEEYELFLETRTIEE